MTIPPRGRDAPAEAVAEARRLYEGSALNVSEIARLAGLPRSTVQSRIKRESWTRDDPLARRTLVTNIRERVECEIAAAQSALVSSGGVRLGHLERASRALASLFRTLREMDRYDRERAQAAREEAADDVVDPDELYRDLARRLTELKQRGT